MKISQCYLYARVRLNGARLVGGGERGREPRSEFAGLIMGN